MSFPSIFYQYFAPLSTNVTYFSSHQKSHVNKVFPIKIMGLLQNDKVHQDIVYCFQTETYILYENLILQQPQVIAAIPKVSCKHGLWLVARVNEKSALAHLCPGAFFLFFIFQEYYKQFRRKFLLHWAAPARQNQSGGCAPELTLS